MCQQLYLKKNILIYPRSQEKIISSIFITFSFFNQGPFEDECVMATDKAYEFELDFNLTITDLTAQVEDTTSVSKCFTLLKRAAALTGISPLTLIWVVGLCNDTYCFI